MNSKQSDQTASAASSWYVDVCFVGVAIVVLSATFLWGICRGDWENIFFATGFSVMAGFTVLCNRIKSRWTDEKGNVPPGKKFIWSLVDYFPFAAGMSVMAMEPQRMFWENLQRCLYVLLFAAAFAPLVIYATDALLRRLTKPTTDETSHR